MSGTLTSTRLVLVPWLPEQLVEKSDRIGWSPVTFAFADPRVCLVCAHTLPGAMASARVLEKCGFTRVPDVVDPEDGLVWRFERRR